MAHRVQHSTLSTVRKGCKDAHIPTDMGTICPRLFAQRPFPPSLPRGPGCSRLPGLWKGYQRARFARHSFCFQQAVKRPARVLPRSLKR